MRSTPDPGREAGPGAEFSCGRSPGRVAALARDGSRPHQVVRPHRSTSQRGSVAVLSIDSLHVTYGGAGKSTLLRTISGTLRLHRGRVESGSVRFGETDLASRDPAQTVRMGLVQVPEGRRIFGRLTVEENLRAGGMGNKDKQAKARAQDRVYEMFPVLKERSAQRGALLSGGEQQ